MYIKDSGKLDKAMEASPENVKQLFTADDGLANKMKDTIDHAVKGKSNLFDTMKSGIDDRIDRLDDRIDSQKDYLNNEEKKLRRQFSKLQEIQTQGQQQLNWISSIRNSLGM
jgi:flagellar capping protein FliD